MFSKKVKSLLPSPTIAIDTKAKAFKRQGIPVINLSAGEPNFQTPENIKEAAKRAITDGHTFYSSPEGVLELREAITRKLLKDNKLKYDPSQIIVGAGSKQLLYLAFQVLCDRGDEVIIPLPAWSTFAQQVKLAGGKSVFIKLNPPFNVTVNDIKKVFTAKTKLLLINSPSNPTGAMISPEEMKKIADFVVEKKLLVITDEIYEKLTYTQKHVSIASFGEKIKGQTLTINGVSKAYAMTGWRVGYAAGPQIIIDKMKAFQSQLITNTSTVSQMASIEALNGDQSSIKKMKKAFLRRRNFCIEKLSLIKEISFSQPEGAFYLFVCIEKLLGKKYLNATKWADTLLEKEKVAVVPGEAFFYPGYIRISYAASDEDLTEAMERIRRFIKE